MEGHRGHAAEGRHRGERVRVLLATDETGLAEAQVRLAVLPLCATGRVFVEVPESADAGALVAPPRVTVTWLPRARAGRPKRPRGEALAAAVRGWSAEMLCDGAPCAVWLGGAYRAVAPVYDAVRSAGVAEPAIERPARFALSG